MTLFVGLIQNGETHDIETVRNLVVKYIGEKETIILVTIPATGIPLDFDPYILS